MATQACAAASPNPNPNPNPHQGVRCCERVRVALLQAAARSGGTKQSVTLVVELGSWLEVTTYSNPLFVARVVTLTLTLT